MVTFLPDLGNAPKVLKMRKFTLIMYSTMSETKDLNMTEIWSQTMTLIQSKIPQSDYSAWFGRLHFASEENGKITLHVPSAFYRDKFESLYASMLEEALSQVSGKTFSLVFEIKKESEEKKEIPAEAPKTVKKPKDDMLNPSYTFESFVPGENSNFAYSAAMAIAKNPGSVYNPCLIYGGVGLGKTHLIQSIGHYVQENSNLKVIYVTAENFTNEFIQSINGNNPQQFKNKYRKAQVLLIDDIQFLQKKEGTQNELFNTFNDLYDTGRQIVFTSDRPIDELKDISDRLRSRFERGLDIDILPPNYETRVAILLAKCKERNFVISQDVLEYIANNISSNVRALEACITKLMAYSELLKKDISLETAKEQLKQIINSNNTTSGVTIDLIIKAVSSYFNITPSDIKGKSKNQSIIIPRQIAMYLCRKMTDFSTTEIAAEFGGKNHTTVMYNVQKIESAINSSNSDISTAVDKLTNQIKIESKR